MNVSRISRLPERIEFLQADRAHECIPCFQIFLYFSGNLKYKVLICLFQTYGPPPHHDKKPTKTAWSNFFFFSFSNEYSNKLCCPDIQNLCVVFTVKFNPISERLELIDFMGIT